MNRIEEVVRTVPREQFIPDLVWFPAPPENHLEPLRRSEDPARWAALVNSDDAVATAVVHRPTGIRAISSSTAPWLMIRMLTALRLEAGMRVLEIGAGTGFNAACLATLGAVVTSIEVDPLIADRARANLAGYDVEVVTGDGELGCPDRAPFDRVMATASTDTVPYAWVEQIADGGLIVAPYSGEHCGGALLVLTVADGVARGGAEDEAYFMPLQGQDPTYEDTGSWEELRVEVGPSGQHVSTGQKA